MRLAAFPLAMPWILGVFELRLNRTHCSRHLLYSRSLQVWSSWCRTFDRVCHKSQLLQPLSVTQFRVMLSFKLFLPSAMISKKHKGLRKTCLTQKIPFLLIVLIRKFNWLPCWQMPFARGMMHNNEPTLLQPF